MAEDLSCCGSLPNNLAFGGMKLNELLLVLCRQCEHFTTDGGGCRLAAPLPQEVNVSKRLKQNGFL